MEATEADDRTEEIAPAPGLLKNALTLEMEAAASRLACIVAARTIVYVRAQNKIGSAFV